MSAGARRSSALMRFVRLWLPLLIILTGEPRDAIGTDSAWEGGALLISAGLSVWLLNVLFRLGVRGDRDRERRGARARGVRAHGRWPDEKPQ